MKQLLSWTAVHVGFLLSFWVTPGLGQPPLPENYATLKLYELDRAAKTAQLTPTAKAEAFLNWEASNDWRSLELNDLYNLYSWINIDSVDRRHFSARWTGMLTAPANGAYTLRQVRQYRGTDSRLKVFVSGMLVLDSSGDAKNEARFESQPINLRGGQAVDLRVEMTHDVSQINFSEGAPMVVLTWKAGNGPEAIIPTTAFTPPTGFGPGSSHGLKGEYFADMALRDVRVTRLDPALDIVSSWPPIAPVHDREASELLAACKAIIMDESFLMQAASAGQEKASVFRYSLWRIAYRMRAAERQQLVVKLTSHPEVLRAMTPEAMGRLMEGVYMLPGKEHLTMLGEWALTRPQPRCEAGEFPGWGDGYYQQLNTDFYWQMGLFLQGPYWSDAVSLSDRYLVRPNGECNLAVAYAVAFAARVNRTPSYILTKLREQAEDPSVQGDVLVTWLVAQSFAKGVIRSYLQPLAGFSELESAYVAAASTDYRFWALQEMVARLSSVDRGAEAKRMIQERGGQFAAAAQQQALASWTAKADELTARYRQRDTTETASIRTAYRTELERRRQRAADRGDAVAVQRYTDQLSRLGTVNQGTTK